MLTFFGKTKKVSRPRQGVKQQQTNKAPPPAEEGERKRKTSLRPRSPKLRPPTTTLQPSNSILQISNKSQRGEAIRPQDPI
ncbi:hypothetical protein C0Q88_15625 [Ralstonia pickettii]|uniref:Uncharacterized protein n=1 Tax=Ralstonia pickettii TaxID=329 RepID=A0A2N4TMW0_RALPI|nr:hypothetical protein C0Q88_15625 [Ralstonia pickettii]